MRQDQRAIVSLRTFGTDGLDAVGALRILREDGQVVTLRSLESVVPLEA